MTQFPIGLIVLIIVSILVYFGLAQRVLDRMRLSDKGALAVIAALIIGSFITIPLAGGTHPITLNLGGGLVPIVLAVYLLAKAGTAKETTRAIIGAIITALAIYAVGSLLNSGTTVEPGGRFQYIDYLWMYPLVAGIVAYLAGRSRRGAFIAATLGILLFDIGHYVWLLTSGAPAGRLSIGGAGAFDTIVLSGIVAVLLAEAVGEVRERMQGGPKAENRPDELVEALRKPDLENDNPARHKEQELAKGKEGIE